MTATRASAAVPRPASTVALVRPPALARPPAGGRREAGGDPPAACEVYLLRRADTLRFAPGCHVFPGGAVSPEDASPEALALLDGAAGRPLVDAGVTPAHVVSALRECFEEAGVLIARDAGGRPAHADPALAGQLDAARPSVQGRGGAAAFADLLRRLRLRLDGGALRYIGHWITPSSSPIRFDTRFFLARLPEGAEPAACGRESVDGRWWAPTAALAAAEGTGMTLLEPTSTTLRFLAQFDSFAELVACCDDDAPKLEGIAR